jgi:hypothetical protein
MPGVLSEEWVIDCCLTPTQQLFSLPWREQVNFQWNDDESRIVPDQHAYFDYFYSANHYTTYGVLKWGGEH